MAEAEMQEFDPFHRWRSGRVRRYAVVVAAGIAVLGLVGGVWLAQRGGGAAGTPAPASGRGSWTPSAPSASASPQSSPRSSATPRWTASPTPAPPVPDRAFPHSEDLLVGTPDLPATAGTPRSAEDSLSRTPLTCDGGQPRPALPIARRTIALIAAEAGDASAGVPHDAMEQTIIQFPGTGAAAFLSETREALRRCPNVTDEHGTVLRRKVTADNARSLIVTVTHLAQHPQAPLHRITAYLAVVLIGNDTVLVLHDLGWEAASANRNIFDTVLRRATTRAEAWHRTR